jgi:hypothetical protein
MRGYLVAWDAGGTNNGALVVSELPGVGERKRAGDTLQVVSDSVESGAAWEDMNERCMSRHGGGYRIVVT